MKRCRAMKDGHLVFFNSYGKNEDGTMKKFSDSSYVENEEAVAQSLTQRLSVLRGELWYNIDYGIPLFDKMKSKLSCDIAVAEIIELNPDVVSIDSFVSSVERGHDYRCNLVVNTKDNSINIQI